MKTPLLIVTLFGLLSGVSGVVPGKHGGISRSSKLEGKVTTRFDGGRLATERFYHLGREVGTHRGWYADGTLRFQYHYVDGLSEGVASEWDPAGHLVHEAHFRHGHEEGSQRMWDATGNLRANYVMRDGIRYGRFGALGCKGEVAAGAAK